MILPLFVAAQIGIVQFHTTVFPDTVYVGQQVSYDGVTLVDDVARGNLRANPEYTPSQIVGVTVYDFPFDTTTITDSIVNGTHFRRYLFHRALFPLTPGTYTIPSSTLRYALPASESYGSELQPYTLVSEPSAFVALPMPDAGKPLDFTGAVGGFNDTAFTDGATVRIGDTFVFTVRVSGVGNIDLLPRPVIAIDWATVVNGAERVEWDSTGTLVRGIKEFNWVVTPKVVGDVAISTVRFVYFDPSTKHYAIATTNPIPLTIAAAGMTTDVERQHTEIDTIGDTPFPILLHMLGTHLIAASITGAILTILIVVGVVRLLRRPPIE